MNRHWKFFGLAGLLLLALPACVHADAIVPLLNIFSRETVYPASLALAFIILIETFFLWWFIKGIRLWYHLLFSTIINVVSSAAGSLLLGLIPGDREEWVGFPVGLVIPLFLVTVLVEFPLIRLLYRLREWWVSWRDSLWISVRANLASYLLLLFVVPLVLFLVFYEINSLQDRHDQGKWTDASLIQRESGTVYAMAEVDQVCFLKRYEVKTGKWEVLKKQPIDPFRWDLAGARLACYTTKDFIYSEEQDLSLFSLPKFSLLSKIPGDYKAFRLSPSGEQIALLEEAGETFVQSTPTRYGSARKYRLKIKPFPSTKKPFYLDGFALNQGIDWSPDGKAVVFAGCYDPKLFLGERSMMKGQLAIHLSVEEQLPPCLYVYHLDTRRTTKLTEGVHPCWSHDGKKIAFQRGNAILIYDIATRSARTVCSDIEDFRFCWSPSGKSLLVQMRRRVTSRENFLTVVDVDQPDRRFILDSQSFGNFDWLK